MGVVAAAPGPGAAPDHEGYAVRLLSGVGEASAPWSAVGEVLAASPGGERCLVLTLTDGRTTRLPMAALAADPDTVARDVRRRVRDAHTSPDPLRIRLRTRARAIVRPDWVPGERCL